MEVWKHKNKSEKTVARIVGSAGIIILTVICYVVGALMSQSDNFVINFSLQLFGLNYFAGVLGMLAPLIIYNIMFSVLAGRKEQNYSFTKVNGGTAPYVMNGWTLWAVLSGVFAFLLSFIIYWFAFKHIMILVAPLMIWVWIAQAILSVVVFFIPVCKPLKK